MSNFEKKYGKYALKNLPLMLIMCYAVGYLVQLINPDFLMFLTLNPYEILHGQVWRLFTWIIVPPSSLDIFTLIMLYFYYSVGNALEHTWGTYRFNVYIFMGLFLTILASFAAMGLGYLFYGDALANQELARAAFQMASGFFSTYYINMSILLAFAATFPRAQILLMLIIPVQMKWMGIAYAVLLVLQLVSGTGDAFWDIFYRTAILVSLLNFLIFWLMSRNKIHMTPKQMRHRQEFKREVKVNSKITKHKCAICGKTDEMEGVEFRFCSKCNGNYEYCQDHLFTHEHVK
ncbi:MAG: hypothetical protein IKJ39_07315 [Lachnospiraceae bacterium]|nr:hypothetical protein [Lachnospiraceae bacterium]